jgi:hypothetical protein
MGLVKNPKLILFFRRYFTLHAFSLANIMTMSCLCFKKFSRNSGCQCLYHLFVGNSEHIVIGSSDEVMGSNGS